ncbi:uncharacterized protein LOC125052080 [Pieris napi]|uniref:uncharacterized protein LOC125052080 n=1 Tax=Pieris napi TaxID=78633 RepID=UPI001FB9572E|nr:uncharacterized protein LOC125052080 [Pieris napi]
MFSFRKFSVINCILAIRICFGHFCELSTSKRVNFVCKYYCIVFYIWQIIFLYKYLLLASTHLYLQLILVCFKSISNALIAVFFKESYFFKYCADVETIDKVLRFNVKSTIYSIVVYGMSLIHYIIITIFIFKTYNAGSFFEFCSFLVSDVSLMLASIVISLSYEMFWTRMKLLKDYFKQYVHNGDLTVESKNFHLKQFTHVYKSLLDAVKDANAALKIKMFIDTIFVFSKMVTETHFQIIAVISDGFSLNMILPITSILAHFYLTFLGVIFLELVLKEYEEIKGMIALELVRCEDAEYHDEIVLTLEYLEVRAPRYSIWRIFPLDISLLTGLLNCSVTYIIVLLSFKY